MDQSIARLVRRRAGEECEYCGLVQSDVPSIPYHVDHVVAKQHGGTDDPANLAWACLQCNNQKGTNLTAIDPESGQVVELFNPRQDRWYDHFSREGLRIVGLTPEGRATARLLRMNADWRIRLRSSLD